MPRRRTHPLRVKLIEAIDRPLGFYVLALLIVEAFIATVSGVARFTQQYLLWALLLGVGMFVYITLTVTIIVWNKAHVLMFDRDAHLQERVPYGSEKNPVSGPTALSTQPPVEAK
jgi:hypothetical protein